MKNLFENIQNVKETFESKKIPLFGYIYNVSYSQLGECLGLRISGDVPLAFQDVEIVIVHPDAKHGGWVGIGNIALNAYTHGSTGIEKIPLSDEAITMLEDIYLLYTGSKYAGRFYRQNDINQMTLGSAINAMA